MERDIYLNMARRGSVLFQNCKNRHWRDSELVIFNEVKYIPFEYVMRFDKEGNPINIGVLHDLKGNSLVYAEVQKIEKIEKAVSENE